MRTRFLASIIAVQAAAALTGCGGGGFHSTLDNTGPANPDTSTPTTTTTTDTPTDPQGYWQGTTDDGRTVSGVVTEEGDYWFVYTDTGGSPVGFYAGKGKATSTTPPDGTFTSQNLRQVDFDSGTILAGAISVPAGETVNYTAQSALSGSLDPVTVSGSSYSVAGSWTSTATISSVPADIPMTANSGTYDPATGKGSWNLTADASAITGAVITFDQTFTIDSATGVGTLNQDASNCTGTGSSFAVSLTCNGLGANFYGPLDAGGAIVAGQQAWAVVTPVSPDAVVFAPTLTMNTLTAPITQGSLDLQYDAAYETSPSLDDIAGNYTATTTGIDSTINPGATFTLNSDGTLVAGTDAGSNCNFTANLVVHASGGNVYDVTDIAFTNDSSGTCAYDGMTFTGVATVATDTSATPSTTTLTITAMNADRNKGFMIIATK